MGVMFTIQGHDYTYLLLQHTLAITSVKTMLINGYVINVPWFTDSDQGT